MKAIRKYSADVQFKAGALVVVERPELTAALKRFKDGEGLLTIERVDDMRSAVANRYYFGVVLKLIADHTGHSVDELHEDMCQRFLSRRVIKYIGKDGAIIEHSYVERSSRQDGHAFFEFVEQVRQFALDDLGVVTPCPNPRYREEREAAQREAVEASYTVEEMPQRQLGAGEFAMLDEDEDHHAAA